MAAMELLAKVVLTAGGLWALAIAAGLLRVLWFKVVKRV